jgi:outer membrane murein-binding lipoprotein Lpp
MSYCDCACAREINHLHAQLRTLEQQLTSLRYDLEHEADERRAAVRQVANDVSDVWLQTS